MKDIMEQYGSAVIGVISGLACFGFLMLFMSGPGSMFARLVMGYIGIYM